MKINTNDLMKMILKLGKCPLEVVGQSELKRKLRLSDEAEHLTPSSNNINNYLPGNTVKEFDALSLSS